MKRLINLEAVLILLCIITLIIFFLHIEYSNKLIVISFAALSLYYLLSGVLVLFNKGVRQGMRLLYFIGLWGISIGIIGVLYKFMFWMSSGYLLLFAFIFSLAIMLFMLIYWKTAKAPENEVIKTQLQPMFYRILVYPIIFLIAFNIPNYELYMLVGEHRNDEKYARLFISAMENPDVQEKQDAFHQYNDEKFGLNDDTGSTEDR